MTRKGITKKQMDAIRGYSRKGYSANKIQQKLSQRHMGLRRTVLLGHVREIKEKQAKPHVERYTPTKYRPAKIGFFQKQVSAYSTFHGESRRIQTVGNGQQLMRVMMIASRHPPKKQFLTISAEALLDDPWRYLERGHWDVRPEITS
jgi:hypothetical protein